MHLYLSVILEESGHSQMSLLYKLCLALYHVLDFPEGLLFEPPHGGVHPHVGTVVEPREPPKPDQIYIVIILFYVNHHRPDN